MEFDPISKQVLTAAMQVHSVLGPGLFAEVYKVCLRHELTKAGLKVLSEVGLPVTYDGATLDVELKSVEQLAPVHKAQLLTYLKLARRDVGLLLNFNTPHLRHGIVRVVNSLPPSRPSRPSR
jgi:GxxExxY protein